MTVRSDDPHTRDGRTSSRTILWTVLLILATLVWGNSFIAIKHIVEYVSPPALVVGAAILIGGLWLVNRRKRS